MIFPNIKKEILYIYKGEFLKLNNLKIDDNVEVEFSFDILRPAYKSNKMEKFRDTKKDIGILKEDDEGLYVESLNLFHFYDYTSNGLTGRQRKTWYKREMRKAIFRIKGGLNWQ